MLHVVFDGVVAAGATTAGQVRRKVWIGRTFVVVIVVACARIWIMSSVAVVLMWKRL